MNVLVLACQTCIGRASFTATTLPRTPFTWDDEEAFTKTVDKRGYLGKVELEVSLYQLETALELCAIPLHSIATTSSVSISQLFTPARPFWIFFYRN